METKRDGMNKLVYGGMRTVTSRKRQQNFYHCILHSRKLESQRGWGENANPRSLQDATKVANFVRLITPIYSHSFAVVSRGMTKSCKLDRDF